MSAIDIFVPGRLCLFGEHSDWAGGYRRADITVPVGKCIVTGTDQGLHARAEPAEGFFELRQILADGNPGRLNRYPAEPAALREVALSYAFDSYAAGVASLVLERFPGRGLRIEVNRRTLPLKKGLSSSAAVSVLTARAFNQVHSLGLSIEEEMEFAYQGEVMTGSECGRMDQACAFGSDMVLLTFDGDQMDVSRLKPAFTLSILLVDLNALKNTRLILRDLNTAFVSGNPGIRDALGLANHRIVDSACSVVEKGDPEALGALMTEAQEIFDRQMAPICPEQLRSPVLHAVLSHPMVAECAWGGKGVGSQGDGTAQLLCRDPDTRRDLSEVLEREMDVSCLELTISKTR
jgi:galactokinase